MNAPLKWTPRNVVNIVLLLVSSVALAVLSLHVVDAPWVGQAQTLAGGLLAGLLIPGSPVGRILDSVFPGGAESAPIDAATVEAAAESLKEPPPMPVRTKRDGSVGIEALLWTAVWGAFAFLVACVHGCGASAGETVPLVIGGAQVVIAGVCTGAEKLCEQNDPACGSGACHAFHTGCSVLSPTSPVQITCDAAPAVATVAQ